CGSNRIEFDFVGPTTRQPKDGKSWSVDHCQKCGHRYMNPQLEWNELSEYYSSSYEPYDLAAGCGESDEAIVVRASETGSYRHVRISPGIRLLDVGCGGGSFLRIARRLGAIVVGVEPSEFGASQTRRQGIDVFHGTLDRFVETCGPGVQFD